MSDRKPGEPLPVYAYGLQQQVQALQEERDLLQSRLSGQTKLTGMLQERAETQNAALRSLIGWITGSDCYKHLPHEALQAAKAVAYSKALSPTQETDR